MADKKYKITFELIDGSEKSVEFTVPQGETGPAGKNGTDGKNGADGKTPVKGVDYWTDAEKMEFANEMMQEAAPLLPPFVTETDNNKIMQVVNGAWSAVPVADSAVKTYVEDYIGSALEGDY